MNNDPTSFRQERIEKLLHELRCEVERGMVEGEIEEEMGFRFYVPVSKRIKNGVVFCEFRTRPVPRYYMHPDDLQPRLRVVKLELEAADEIARLREGLRRISEINNGSGSSAEWRATVAAYIAAEILKEKKERN